MPQFMTGAIPTPRSKLLYATPHRHTGLSLPQSAFVPKKLDPWGNNIWGNCTVAEEAFHLACQNPEIFVDANVVIAWGAKNGFNNGATLTDPMDAMARSGMVENGNTYGDGAYTGVDYSNETILQNALSIAPVKIGIDANALPSGAGNAQGWYTTQAASYRSEDHCVALAGFGPAEWLFQQLGVPVPSGMSISQAGYLLYTWATIGFVTHDWLMGTCAEAWLRNPSSTQNGTALINPGQMQIIVPGQSPIPDPH